MQIVVLLAFVVSMFLVQTFSLAGEWWFVVGPAGAAASVLTYLAVTASLSCLHSGLSLRRLGRSADVSPSVTRFSNTLGILSRAWLVGGLGGCIVLGYGRWVMEDLSLYGVPLAGEAMLLLPFVAALLITWLLEYPYHREVRTRMMERQGSFGLPTGPVWSLGEFLGYNFRHYFLFIAVPIGLIVLANDLIWLGAERFLSGEVIVQVAGYVGSVLSVACVFTIAPVLVVRIWRTHPLGGGHLRDKLEAMCVRMKLRYRAILVWRSGGVIANAGVMGVVPRFRYILLSDAMLENMADHEIESIFAHEAGHILSRHILYAVVFALAVVLVCTSAGELFLIATGADAVAGNILAILLLAAAWGFGFGWVSRRFERQCDVAAAWAIGNDAGALREGRITPEGAAIFARSLERIAQLNGIPPRQHNWRHGSIANRVAHVLYLGSTGGTRKGIDRVVRRIKAAVWVAFVAGAALLAVSIVLSETMGAAS